MRINFKASRRVVIEDRYARIGARKAGVYKLFSALGFLFLVLAIFYRFHSAESDFSFDYRHYINFFEVLNGVSFEDIRQGLEADVPALYVSISGTHLLFEAGFVALAWGAVTLLGSPFTVYALIATISVSIRLVLLSRMGVPWIANALINVYAITLFESNALRLGCGVTFILIAIHLIRNEKSPALVVSVLLVASLFHAQTLFFSLFLLPLYYGFQIFARRGVGLLIMAGALTVSALLAVSAFSVIGSQKLSEYAGREAGSAGFTVVSLLALLLVSTALWSAVVNPRTHYSELIKNSGARLRFSIILSSLPSLLVMIFASNQGAVGVRLWQASFVVLCVAFLGCRYFGGRNVNQVERFLLVLLLIVSLFNIIYRFPLSNFFYPIFPYANTQVNVW